MIFDTSLFRNVQKQAAASADLQLALLSFGFISSQEASHVSVLSGQGTRLRIAIKSMADKYNGWKISWLVSLNLVSE